MEGRFYFQGAGCRLSAVDFGNSDAQPMVILHGMRDHALSMQSIALAFTDYHVISVDLRGHGDSDNPGSYTMTQMVADLRAFFDHSELKNPVLIGHSLGGHIVSKFAALYPDEVESLILIDGMGPPSPVGQSSGDHLVRWRDHIAGAIGMRLKRKSMPDKHEAFERLSRNNPKLSEATARFIVEHGVEIHPEGGVCWKWDPRVNMIWSTFSHDESEELYREITCPVLIITGEHSLDYWAENRVELAGQDDLHSSELERRQNLFQHAEHHIISGAGHMIHYDEPEDLNGVIRDFLTSTQS
jgi:pimeloyl-ACP methyl ester carboxylesterase